MARIELIRRHAKGYDLILQILEKLSNGMNGCIDFHCDEGKLLFRLATGKSDWHLLGEKEKKSLFRSSDLIRAIDNGNEDVARLIAIDRIINYIRYGKITFHSSYYYQDLGAKIKRVRIGRDEGFLNSDVLEQLISGTFPINIWPLYEAIGFLGRNLRFRDSEQFRNLRYFIQRYITEETLRLELRFINHCMDLLSGRNVEAVVIDTMGIEGRKKSILASYHGRYHTIGMADLRAVATDMCPIYSGDYSATDSEAMNIVEVIAQVQVQVQVQAICGDNVKIYSGDCHTTSRVSAGMVFLSHGIVAAGRIHHKPRKQLGKKRIKRLRENIPLLNKVGMLLREEPTLGRVIAMKIIC